MTSVWVVLIIDHGEELMDVVGVRTTEHDARALAGVAARDADAHIDRWVTVGRTPDQGFIEAIESLPQDGVYFRAERHRLL
jgi:hypothetical protein